MQAKLLEQTTAERLFLPDQITWGPFLAIACCLWGGGSGHRSPKAAGLGLPEIPSGWESGGGGAPRGTVGQSRLGL